MIASLNLPTVLQRNHVRFCGGVTFIPTYKGKAILSAAILAGSFAVTSCVEASQILVRDITLIDAASEKPREHRDVLIEGDRIKSVGESGALHSHNARTVDGRHKFLIPGLWNSHVHISTIDPALLPLYVADGITSVRDMGGNVADLRQWREEITSGKRVGPRIKFCGPMIEGSDKFSGPDTDKYNTANHIVAHNPAEARALVAKIAADGADCIKMRTFADKETYFALANAAKAAELPFVGHPPFGLDPFEALTVVQQTFEHAYYPYPLDQYTPEKREALFSKMRANGVILSPTLITWEPSRLKMDSLKKAFESVTPKTAPARFISPSLQKSWAEGLLFMMDRGTPGWFKALDKAASETGQMYRAGIPVIPGTDDGAPFLEPVTSLYGEIELLVRKAGLTPYEALVSATSTPTKLFHQEAELGTIEAGKYADLVLLNTDPLMDTSWIAHIDTVIAAGHVYDAAARRRLKESVRKALELEWRSAATEATKAH